jgi:hypothetical protein
MSEHKKSKSLTEVVRESLIKKYFKHGHSFYRVMEAEMGRTGHLFLEAELYSSSGEYKGMTTLHPLMDQFHYVEDKDLPWYTSPTPKV